MLCIKFNQAGTHCRATNGPPAIFQWRIAGGQLTARCCLLAKIIVHLTLLYVLYINLEMSCTMKFYVSLYFRDVIELIKAWLPE